MSFTFQMPRFSRGSSHDARGGWRAVSVFSVQRSVLRPPEPSFAPPVDVYETDSEVLVRMEIAGIDPSGVNIAIVAKDRLVTISGQRRDPAAGQPRKYQSMEIECGPFSRQIRLPAEIDETKASAHYSDGFLVVSFPKAQSHVESSRSVPIE